MSQLIERITAAFNAEQPRRHEKVHRADQLPLSYEAITDDWLTDVLCRNHPGARVSGHVLDVDDNGSSNRRKITVEYNEAGRAAGLPTALFCKATHGLANRIILGLAGGAHCEVSFYNNVRPQLDIEAPRCFFARLDSETFNSIVVLNDLSRENVGFCTHQTPISRARVESQLRLLAEVHGKSSSSPQIRARLSQFPTWGEYFTNTLGFGMQEGSEKGFREAQDVIPPRLYRRHREIWPATLASVERHAQLPQLLAHGDVHLKNWYIAASGEMGLGDWQCATRGYWARDFAYTIATALTVEDRRAWETDLLRFYLERMRAAGGPAIGFDEAWMHYRQQLMTALTWWTITLAPAPGMPEMQPRDITLEFIRRMATAIDDVDSLDSFAEAPTVR